MDPERQNLKQCGQSTISIFPSHPHHQFYNKTGADYDPAKEGFKKEYGVYVKPKKAKDKIIGYEVYNETEKSFEIHDAQNVSDLMSQMLRSINLSTRNFLTSLSKLKRELENEQE